jgi:hypothetical protein
LALIKEGQAYKKQKMDQINTTSTSRAVKHIRLEQPHEIQEEKNSILRVHTRRFLKLRQSVPASYHTIADNSQRNISTMKLGQPKEKYFNYLVFNFVDYGLSRSGARRHALSRKLSATLGGSTSTRP